MAEKKPVMFKKGAYIFHVFIEELRGLVASAEDSTVDPLVEVTVFGKKRFTKTLDDVGSTAAVYLGEHLFFMESHLEVAQVERGKILIQVKDKKFLGKTALIGQYELDIAYVYQLDGHAIQHSWIALSNPDGVDFSQVTGYVKVGVNVCAEGDDQTELDKPEEQGKEGQILMPPCVPQQPAQVVVRILKGQNFYKMDSGGGCDPYFIGTLSGVEVKGSVIACTGKNNTAVFCEDIFLPISKPNCSAILELKCWDYDKVGGDDLMGYLLFKFQDIEKGVYKQYFWASIYGAHGDISNEEALKMNKYPHLASCFKGMLLLRVYQFDHKQPVAFLNKQFPQKEIDQMKVLSQTTQWEMRAIIYNGTALPKNYNGYKLQITVACADQQIQSQAQKSQNGRINWLQNLGQKVFELPVSEMKDVPDVFIYLTYEDKKFICFQRFKVSELNDPLREDFWIKFQPDKAIGDVKEDFDAGYVRVKLYFGKQGQNSDLSVGNWNQKFTQSAKSKSWSLACNIFQARGLPAGDEDGVADPYCTVYCDGTEKKTVTKEDTLNPIWYEQHYMEVAFDEMDDAPPIIISVFDYDQYTANDLLGLVVVNLKDAAINVPEIKRPQWYPLSLGKEGTEQGEILLSFNLMPKGQQIVLPPTGLCPPMKDTNLEFKILGLRELQSTGLFPVRKAFIKFDLNSLIYPGEKFTGNKNIFTQPRDPGANPNINTVIKFEAIMPEDPLYWPTMSCTVFDNLFSGLSQPQIGVFNIPLADILAPKKGKQKQQKVAQEEGEQEQKQTSMLEEEDKEQLQVQVPQKWSKQGYEEKPDEKELQEIQKDQPGVKKIGVEKLSRTLTKRQARDGEFIKKPQYEKNEAGFVQEINVPDPDYFLELGHDKKPGSGDKHYRYCLPTALEESEFIDPSPFNCYDVTRGQARGNDSLFGFLGGDANTLKKVGQFKAILKVKNERYMSEEQKKELQDQKGEKDKITEELDKALMTRTPVIVRVYILDAKDLMSMDSDSNSDPYVVLKLGSTKISDEQNYKEDDPNPKIFKHFDLETELPGASLLKIQMWDHDALFADEMIGKTTIDLEDRFFSAKWRRLGEKPIETRKLMHQSSSIVVGSIRLWVEIFPRSTKTREMKLYDITPRPAAKFDARLVVWGTQDVANVDVEGCTDIYVRAFINDMKAQETDTHLRCQNGKGSFNWRMIWPLTLPQPVYRITIQIWDFDVLSFNDFIAEATFTFNETAETAFNFNTRTKMTGIMHEPGVWKNYGAKTIENSEKFEIPCKRRNEQKQLVDGGKVIISFELVPDEKAKSVPVGLGRDEPNVDPVLPEPVGRIEFSLNPFKMISQMCGPEFKAKICSAICCVLCLVACVMMAPMIFSNLLSQMLMSPFT